MFDLFGESMPLGAKFFIAFAVVLALIGLTAWLVRRFGADRLGGGNARGRQPRLAVIDAAPVDGRRRLVLIRRDNVEHLLMIGGPTDVVVEQNIVRAASAREPARAELQQRETSTREPSSRQTPVPADNAWPLQPAGEPTPVAAPRPYRAAATEEPWLPPEPGARPRPSDSNSLSNLAVELSTKLAPPDAAPPPPALRQETRYETRQETRQEARQEARHEPRHEPPVMRAAPPPPLTAPEPVAVAPQQSDSNLAEMAQQLEAALRRAPGPEGRPPVTDPLAQPPRAAEPPPRQPARDYKLRIDPKFETRAEPKFDSKPEPKFDVPAEPRFEPRASQPPAKTVFDNLEEEMASLLGRPPGKT